MVAAGWARAEGPELTTLEERARAQRLGLWQGGAQPSFDKQFVRDWLESVGWDKASPAPFLPEEVVVKTRLKYIEAYEKLTGRKFPWA